MPMVNSYDWITPARMERLEKLAVIDTVRQKEHVSRDILRQRPG
jgi:hypothetical protein